MAHLISMVGGQANLAYTGQVPWHGLGVFCNHSMDWAEAYKLAKLDWSVSLEPSGYLNTEGKFIGAVVPTSSGELIPEKYHVVRSDNGEIIGTVGKGFSPIQNRDCFSILNAVVQEQLATIEVVGSLKRGQIIWVLAKLPGYIKVKGEDMVNKYILLANAHDGSMRFIMMIVAQRVVCWNTLLMALDESGSRFSAKHTRSIGMRIGEIRDALGVVNEWFTKDFTEMTQKLVSKDVTAPKLKSFLTDLGYGDNTGRSKGIRQDITRLFESGLGNNVPGVSGTAWALLNGVTEYIDYERSTKVQGGSQSAEESRLVSAWFKDGKETKLKALELALAL